MNGCHGSGYNNCIFASFITAIDMMFADGSMRTIRKDQEKEDFYRYIINFGCVGIITNMTMVLRQGSSHMVLKKKYDVKWDGQYQKFD